MNYKTQVNLLLTLLLLLIHQNHHAASNPIAAYDPTSAPLLSYPPMPMQAPMLMTPQYDPYAMSMPHYVFSPPAFGPQMQMQMALDRRSHPSSSRKSNNNKAQNDQSEMTEEQKALAGVPLSFIEPEGPSTIPERISDSFSALGEGVKNHFRSLTENFSDTLDDIKDAWRFEGSKKRNRMSVV